MTLPIQSENYNPDKLLTALFGRAKTLLGFALILKFLIYIVGITAAYGKIGLQTAGILSFIFYALSEWTNFLSDRYKGMANTLHRKLDLEKSLGIPLKKTDLSDALARYTGNVEKFRAKSENPYFASTSSVQERKGAENLLESAWWTMHLAEAMSIISITTIVLIVFGCGLFLNLSLESVNVIKDEKLVPSSLASDTAVKVVSSSLMFILSLGLLKFSFGYLSYYNKAKHTKEKTELMLSGEKIELADITKLWADYHLAREVAPLIPDWLWNFRKDKLNLIWESQHCERRCTQSTPT